MKPRTPCRIWTGRTTKDGYGLIAPSSKQPIILVHRLVWEAAHGKLKKGKCALHRCDNPPCYRLSHLFKGTRADNNKDKIEKGRGRGARGERNSHAKLTAAQVIEARRRYQPYSRVGDNLDSLAAEFGVTRSAMSAAISGKTWNYRA